MTIQAVIFDFGGVIARLDNVYGQRKWERYLGLSKGELFKIVLDSEVSTRAMVGKVPEAEVWKQVAATLALNDAQSRAFRRDFWQGERLNVDLVRFIRGLRPRYKTAVLTNAWSGAREEFTRDFGLHELVDVMIISAEEGVAKPDLRIYQIAAERLGVRAHKAVFVDDLAENVGGAQAAGMRGVHYKNSAQAIAEVRAYLEDNEQYGSPPLPGE